MKHFVDNQMEGKLLKANFISVLELIRMTSMKNYVYL